MCARSRAPVVLPEAAAVASRLRRSPRQGRVWYQPARSEIPRAVVRADLVDRLYREGGPKHGLCQRSDAIDTLWRGYTYLRLRAQREGSGDYATTAEQTVVGLTFELSRRAAKAWDVAVAAGLEGHQRREELLRRRGSAVAKLLDELAGAGLIVWGGERDNNGLWWRLRIRLLDPDEEQPPDWEPWMRGIDPPRLRDGRDGGKAPSAGEADSGGRAAAKVDLGGLYRRVEALTGHRPRLEGHQVAQLRTAVGRFAASAGARPAGTPCEPLEVLLVQVEHFAPREESALAWALARFDGYTRQLAARARASAPGAVQSAQAGIPGSSGSPNCAALFNQQLNPNVSETSALACTTGAREPADDMHDAEKGSLATEGSGRAKQRTEGEEGPAGQVDIDALLERVAAREARLEALWPQLRAQEGKTVTRARNWTAAIPVPVSLLTEAAQAYAGGTFAAPRPWLTDRQVERLRRAERRYVRYVDNRPSGSPPAPATVLIDLVEQAAAEICAPLPCAIAQRDLLSKLMRREERRINSHRGARPRAQRRLERDVANAGAFYRRPPPQIEAAVDHLADGFRGQPTRGKKTAGWIALESQLQAVGELPTDTELEAAKRRDGTGSRQTAVENRGWRWRELNSPEPRVEELTQLANRLHAIGVGVNPEQLRRKIRDRLLLTDRGQASLEQLKRAESELTYTPESYHPECAQLTARDVERADQWAWRRYPPIVQK